MAEFHVNEGTRVVSYLRRDLREERGIAPSHGTIIQPAVEGSLVAFDDGDVERVANDGLLPEGACPLCEKANRCEAVFCGDCGVNLGEQAMLRSDEIRTGRRIEAGAARVTESAVEIPETIGQTPSGKSVPAFPSVMYSSNAIFAESTEGWGLVDHKAAAMAHYQAGPGRNVIAGQAHEALLIELGGMLTQHGEPLAGHPGAGGIVKRY